jgi:hypothetical protein
MHINVLVIYYIILYYKDNPCLSYIQISTPIIVRVMKSRIMRWAGHVVRMGESRGIYRVLLGKPEVRDPLKNQTQMGG